MRILVTVFIILIGTDTAFAQNNGITFPSAQLQEMALRYTGDTLNWPILVQISDRNISDNTFALSQSDLLQLQNLSEATAIVLQQKERM